MKRNMHLSASPQIFKNAHALRKHPTPAEQKLWSYLEKRQMEGEKFRRQHPLLKFIPDFYCYKLRLAIEVDGEIHSSPTQNFYDVDRTNILMDEKLHVLRFPNEMVLNQIESVLEAIRAKIREI